MTDRVQRFRLVEFPIGHKINCVFTVLQHHTTVTKSANHLKISAVKCVGIG